MKIKNDFDLLDEFIKEDKEENPKIENAKKEIRMLITITPFPVFALLIMSAYFNILEKNLESGTGYTMFLFIMIYLVWVSVILHTNKKKKIHHTVYPKENY